MNTPAVQVAGPLDVGVRRLRFSVRSYMFRPSTGVPLCLLDNAASTQHPRQVIQAMVDTYEKHYANVHAQGIHSLSDQTTDLYEQARKKFARSSMLPRPSSR